MITRERLRAMAHALLGVPGIEAVVLGGSRARGAHHDHSDVDLGLYYRAGDLDVDALNAATESVSDVGRVEVAGPGGWGPWVDGGAWLTVEGTPVDWILRDIARVRTQCGRALAGEFAFHAQPGHPLGFLDVSTPARSQTVCRSRTRMVSSLNSRRRSTPIPGRCAPPSSTTSGRRVS